MRGFLVLCLIAVTTAEQFGYNYQHVGQNVAIGGGLPGGTGESETTEINSGSIGGLGGGFVGFTGGNDAGNFNGGNNGIGGFEADSSYNTEYNKEFYTFSAPEEDFNDHAATQLLSNTLKKSLRVIFIKTPENHALTNAALQLAKQGSDDRTAIYVLNKQSDLSDLASKLQTIQSNNVHKPEVHFVKYRTAEDAARAQHAIQSQYESLGSGQSHSSNEGVAPVLNFASPISNVATPRTTNSFSAGHSISSGSGLSITSGAYVAPKVASAYLPAALRLK